MSLCHYAFDDFSSFVLGMFFFSFILFCFFTRVNLCGRCCVEDPSLRGCVHGDPWWKSSPSETLWYAESVPSNRIRSVWTAQSNYITSESFLVLQYLLRISHTVGTAPARPIKTRCPRSELFTSQPAMSWEFCLEAFFFIYEICIMENHSHLL